MTASMADAGERRATTPTFPALSHKEILEILSGLMLALFVSNVSSTVVSNALPSIMMHLGSTQQQYTWIVTASLLASTASTPIWGKLSDLFDKKLLMQLGIGVFIVGSLLCGFATDTAWLIGSRAVQGIGLGALMALVQSILGTIIPPRQRGRYAAYTGATMAVATVVGPLVGGFIVDQSWLGWRWCFFSAVPFALAALLVLQWRLRVPLTRRAGAKVDWVGATLVTAGVSLLLIWISFAGNEFPWWSWQTVAMVIGAIVIAVAFVLVELRVSEPIIPMRILTTRTTALAVLASIAVGIGMYGASVFLGQYYQLARGYSPTEAGLMMVPMMLGVACSSLFIGRLVTRVGRWKPFVVVGAVLLAVGFALMGTIGIATPLWHIAIFMALAGLGLGMTMQNLVLAVQNSVSVRDVGASSATVTFFRSLGGAVGIQVLGVLFAHRLTAGFISRVGNSAPVTAKGTPNVSELPDELMPQWQAAYGSAIGTVFLVAAGIAVLSILAVAFMTPTTLRDSIDLVPQLVKDDARGHTQAKAQAEVESQATATTGETVSGPTAKARPRQQGEPTPESGMAVSRSAG